MGAGHIQGSKGWLSIVRAGQAVSSLLVAGDIKVPALEVISLEQIPEKLMTMRDQHTTGKIVVRLTAQETFIRITL